MTEHDTTNNGWRSVRRVEKVDFKAEAEALLEKLHADRPWRDRLDDRFGMVLSGRAAAFLTGRDCLERGHTGLAMQLLNRAPQFDRDINELRSFGQMLADEFARCELWGVTLDFSALAVSREAIRARLDSALKRYPTSACADRMKAMADRLQIMAEHDRARPTAAKPFETMTPEEQVDELIYQLRNQNGRQFSQPGWCNIFAGDDANEMDASPASRLAKMGHPAVPALIETLDCETYSRSVGFWREFRFSHSVLTVGDCALAILQRIANQTFHTPRTTSSYMSRDGEVKATRAAVEKWWAKTQEQDR